jgi:hypothetical protein
MNRSSVHDSVHQIRISAAFCYYELASPVRDRRVTFISIPDSAAENIVVVWLKDEIRGLPALLTAVFAEHA